MSMLFSLMDASILLLSATISTVLYDAIRTLEDNWDEMIQAIETGNLPIIPSVEGHRVHLEVSVFSFYCLPIFISKQKYIKANPARANELRALEKGQEGWLKKVWPSLATITVTLSGPYAACLPQVWDNLGVESYIHLIFASCDIISARL